MTDATSKKWDFEMIKFDRVIATGGNGLWAKLVANVQVRGIDNQDTIDMLEDEEGGVIDVYFDTASWDTERDGLIYTDDTFLENLKAEFVKMGLDPSGMYYTEWSLQGDDFVSFDVDYPLALGLSKLKQQIIS